MEEFAQTRGLDSLFEDDFTPLTERVDRTTQKSTKLRPQGNNQANHPRGQENSRPNAANQVEEADSQKNKASLGPKPSAAVRGDRSATGGINKPKLTETELSKRLEAAKVNSARREEAHRLAEADEASFQKREAQASQKRTQEGVTRRAMEGEREKNRLRKLGARAGREWDEGKDEEQVSSPRESQYRRGAHGGVAYRDGGRQQGGSTEHEPRYQEETERGYFGHRGGRGKGDRGRGDRSRGDRGRAPRGGRGRGSGFEGGKGIQNVYPNNQTTPPNLRADSEFPSLSTSRPGPKPGPRSKESKGPLQQPLASSQNDIASSSSKTEEDRVAMMVESKDAGVVSSPVVETESWADQVEANKGASG